MMYLSIASGLIVLTLVVMTWGAMKQGSFRTTNELGDKEFTCFEHAGIGGWIMALMLGGGVAAVNYLSTLTTNSSTGYWALVWASIVMFGLLLFWWLDDGSSPMEATMFVILTAIVLFVAAMPAAAALTENVRTSDFAKSFWPTAMGCAAIGIAGAVISTMFKSEHDEALLDAAEADEADDAEAATTARKTAADAKTLSTIVAVIAAVAILALLLFCVKWGELKKPEPEPEPEPVAVEPVREAWYTFGVLELLEDDDETNNANFGADLYEEEMTPEEAWAAVKWAAYRNPINGITTVYYNDAVSGNRYLEKYYLAFDNDTDAINEAIRDYVVGEAKYDNTEYRRLLDSMFGFVEANRPELELYTSKELKKMGVTISDQFYCNPFSNFYDQDGVEIPASIIYDCGTGEEEMYLHLTYKVKYNTAEWWVHLGCGGQLANVSGKLRVTVEKNPNTPKPSSTPTSTKPSPTPSNTTTTPTTPTVPKPKDITVGTPVGTNDVPGPGPDTNGDPYWSSKDDEDHSSHMTDEEYHAAIDYLEEINTVSREGGTPNTPSTPTPADTKIDNPGDTGTAQNGWVGIDTPTPVADEVHDQTTGQQITNQDEKTALPHFELKIP